MSLLSTERIRVEVRSPARKLSEPPSDPLLDGVALPSRGAALDHSGAHERSKAHLVIRDIQRTEIDLRGDVKERQFTLLLDVAAEAVFELHAKVFGIGRVVLERGVFQIGRLLCLGQAGRGAQETERQYDRY